MFKPLAVAVVAALGLSSALASTGTINGVPVAEDGSVASPYQLGTLSRTPIQLVATSSASFEDLADFSVGTRSLVRFLGANEDGVDSLEFKIYGPGTWNSLPPLFDFTGDSVAENLLLDAGAYRVVISGGVSAGFSQATYSLGMAAVPVPVPEPESYALMLAGLGAVGFVARRRRPV